MTMNKTRDRPFKRPTVEIAASRNAQVFKRQKFAQTIWNVTAVCAVLATGYFFGGVGLGVLVLMIFTGILAGSAINALRAFGEHTRLMAVFAGSLEEVDANVLRSQLKLESRSVLARLVIAAVFGVVTVVWVAVGGGRLWVVLPCIGILAYAHSSVKTLLSDPSSFAKLTSVAEEEGCRVGLFRSFRERTSSLARSALAPILAGYGSVDIVLDETFEHAHPQGVFGLEVADFGGLCKVHRFKNEEWEDRVGEIIGKCDIAVIDSTIVRHGVMWEVAQCYKHLPPYRVFLVVDSGALKDRSLEDHMKAIYDELRTHREMPANVRPYVFVFAPSAWQQEALANDIHRKMLEIIAIEEGYLDADRQYGG